VSRELVLVRHGETEWARSGRHTGRTDVDLTDGGRGEARTIGAALSGRPFAAVLVSPMHRAIETARLAGFGAVEVVDDLREWDYGDYEGRTTPEIREDVPGWTVWTDPSPGGEAAAEVAARVDRVIARVRAIDGDVLVFGHGHSLRVLGARWCDLPPTDGRALALDPGAICVLGYERETPVLRHWNWRPRGEVA
jgi:probable phosphoglycerate mutase